MQVRPGGLLTLWLAAVGLVSTLGGACASFVLLALWLWSVSGGSGGGSGEGGTAGGASPPRPTEEDALSSGGGSSGALASGACCPQLPSRTAHACSAGLHMPAQQLHVPVERVWADACGLGRCMPPRGMHSFPGSTSYLRRGDLLLRTWSQTTDSVTAATCILQDDSRPGPDTSGGCIATSFHRAASGFGFWMNCPVKPSRRKRFGKMPIWWPAAEVSDSDEEGSRAWAESGGGEAGTRKDAHSTVVRRGSEGIGSAGRTPLLEQVCSLADRKWMCLCIASALRSPQLYCEVPPDLLLLLLLLLHENCRSMYKQLGRQHLACRQTCEAGLPPCVL